MNFKIITFATNLEQPILKILKSKLPLIFLNSTNFDWEGVNGTKVVYNFLKTVPDTDLILLTDCYDVLPLNGCNYEKLYNCIINKFNIDKLTFNAEKNCYPNPEKAALYPKAPGPWKYLNGGLATGTAKAFLKVFDILMQQKIVINQENYTDIFLSTDNLISLDYRCEIFQNVLIPEKWPNHDVDLNEFYIEDKTLINKYFNTKPLLFHGAGNTNLKKLFPFVKTISS